MSNTRVSEGEVKRKFGQRMRALRNKRSFSQEKLAFEIDMDLTSINEIERGHRSPKLITVVRIANALNVSVSEMMDF